MSPERTLLQEARERLGPEGENWIKGQFVQRELRRVPAFYPSWATFSVADNPSQIPDYRVEFGKANYCVLGSLGFKGGIGSLLLQQKSSPQVVAAMLIVNSAMQRVLEEKYGGRIGVDKWNDAKERVWADIVWLFDETEAKLIALEGRNG